MAEETKKTVLEVKIEAAEAAKTVADLKKALKGLVDQQESVTKGSAEWKKLAKAINETEGKIGDLQDSFATLRGSGIERATAGINFLKEGFLKLDFGLVKTGLQGLRTALASTGILLLVQGVNYLVENFEDLTKGSGGVAKALKTVGDIVGTVINYFTDLIGLTTESERTLKKQAESVKKFAEQSTQSLSSTTAEYDRQIAVIKANGKSTLEIEKQKQIAIMETNASIIHQLLAYKKAGGELSDDQRKQLVASTEAINNARNAITVSEIENNKKKNDDYKKKLEERKDADKKYLDAIQEYKISQIKDETDRLDEEAQFKRKKRDEEIKESKASAEVKRQALINSENMYQNELTKILKDYQDKKEKERLDEIKRNDDLLKEQHKKENEDLKAQGELNLITYKDNADMLFLAKQNQLEIQKNIELENTQLTESQKALIIAKYEEQVSTLKKEQKKKTEEENYKIAEQGLKSVQNLSDIFFTIQSSKAKKGSAEAEALAKKQFKVNKALQLSLAVMDGYKAITASLAQAPVAIGPIPNPAGIASLAFAATTSALNVAKILATQYESTSSGGGAETPSPSIGSTGETPTITQPMSQQPTTPGTNFDAQGNVIGGGPMKAYVVETEITNKQTTVNRLQSQAEFG